MRHPACHSLSRQIKQLLLPSKHSSRHISPRRIGVARRPHALCLGIHSRSIRDQWSGFPVSLWSELLHLQAILTWRDERLSAAHCRSQLHLAPAMQLSTVQYEAIATRIESNKPTSTSSRLFQTVFDKLATGHFVIGIHNVGRLLRQGLKKASLSVKGDIFRPAN